jgi:hypothetical protein
MNGDAFSQPLKALLKKRISEFFPGFQEDCFHNRTTSLQMRHGSSAFSCHYHIQGFFPVWASKRIRI